MFPVTLLRWEDCIKKILTRALATLFENFNLQIARISGSRTVPFGNGISTYVVKNNIVSIPNQYGTVQPARVTKRKWLWCTVPYWHGSGTRF